MKFDILTIFPKMLDSYISESILKRAQEKKLIKIVGHDIRAFSKDRHKKVDDRPYGGGAGMVMSFQPIADAVAKLKTRNKKLKTRIILFSTRGNVFTNKDAKRLAKYDQLIFICGRYEGVDQRVAEYVADEEISLGDYVITGGELAAGIVIDAVSRQIPGVLGKTESLEEQQGSYPTYTKPEIIKDKKKTLRVPKVLTEGNHKLINEWRAQNGLSRERSNS